jgi:signal transduction histidine kinase
VRSAARLRFVATVGESALRNSGVVDPQLLEALSGVCLRLPPLRERADSISALVSDVAVAWCGSRGERPRHFSEEALDVLRAYPWPGNQRELEAVVARTLAAVSSDPVQPGQLRFEALPTPAGPVSHRPEEEEIARSVAGPGGEVPEEAEIAPAVLAPPAEEITGTLRRLVGAVAHEVRNPLVAIRTFAELLPDRFEDEEFRSRFAAAVEADVERIESVVDRLSHLATMPAPVPGTLDVAALIEELLDARREAIRERHVLVLKELDRSQPFAVGDPEQLRFALESLLDKAFTIVPERGDVYVASKYHDSGLRGDPSCRVLVRFHGDAPGGPGARVQGVSLAETSLDLVVAEAVVRSQGGSFRLDTIDSEETVVVLDLPAPR